jgi:hypothetical protein
MNENPFIIIEDVLLFPQPKGYGQFDVFLRSQKWIRRYVVYCATVELPAQTRQVRIINKTWEFKVHGLALVIPFTIVHDIKDGDIFLFGDEVND